MFKIVIVEDSEVYRQSLKETLANRFPSACLEEAADGAQAWRLIQTAPPNLVFVDIRLPGESGLELTKRIKSRYAHVSVIIITNYDLPEYREAAFRYGADYFLPKESSTWEEMARIVERVVSRVASPRNGSERAQA
jgi:DNA-binding NarL/FixJ family response regulator